MNKLIKKVILTTAILGAIVGGGYYFKIAQADIYGSSLVAWWNMDSNKLSGTTLTDVTGGGSNGTTLNSPPLVAGTSGQAMSFNGTNQAVSLGTSALDSIITGSTQTFTISAWVNGAGGAVLAKYSNNSGSSYSYAVTAGSSFGIVWYNFGATNGGQFKAVQTNVGSLPSGWNFITVTYDGNQGTRETFYINGVLAPSSVTSGLDSYNIAQTNAVPATIGAAMNALNAQENNFAGSIDDLRVYNRVLSASEIRQLYYQGIQARVSPF